jgi:hypothetical protein
MKNRYDNAVALLIFMVSGEISVSLIFVPLSAPLNWWLIAQLPILIVSMALVGITSRSHTKNE